MLNIQIVGRACYWRDIHTHPGFRFRLPLLSADSSFSPHQAMSTAMSRTILRAEGTQ